MRSVRMLGLMSGVAMAAVLSACGEGGSAASGPPAWVLVSAPEGASGVVDAKASAVEGDAIVLRGIIGGTMEPLTADSATFRIVDTGLYNRCTSEDDHCSTPWDYCCATPDDLMAHSATVQIVGADGSAIAGSPLDGALGPLDEVVVVGTVGARPNADVLVVRATGVHRAGG